MTSREIYRQARSNVRQLWRELQSPDSDADLTGRVYLAARDVLREIEVTRTPLACWRRWNDEEEQGTN